MHKHFLMASIALSGQTKGGILIESLSAVLGRSTLPASAIAGKPSAPVMVSVGRQVLFKINSTGSSVNGCTPECSGNASKTCVPKIKATLFACSIRSWGISQCSSGSLITPVCSSSKRLNKLRATRKLSATIPLAPPECTPSFTNSTTSSPATCPLNEVVIHNCS